MKVSIKDLPNLALEYIERFRKYAVVLFVILVVVVYGFLVLRINSMQSAQPDSVSGNQKVTALATPRIDPKLITQLQQLQDNSVNVKTLFDQARSNPFQE